MALLGRAGSTASAAVLRIVREARADDANATTADLFVAAVAVGLAHLARRTVDAGPGLAGATGATGRPVGKVRCGASHLGIADVLGAGVAVVAGVPAGTAVRDRAERRLAAVGRVGVTVAETVGTRSDNADPFDTVGSRVGEGTDDAAVPAVARVAGDIEAGIAAGDRPLGADADTRRWIESPLPGAFGDAGPAAGLGA
jgi:hypothetical protein